VTDAAPAGRPTTFPPVLTVGDFAALLGLQSERAAREFIAREHVPHVRKGKRVLVLLDSLLAWLKSYETTDQRADRVRAAADRLRAGRRNAAAAALARLTPHSSSL
jgi:hypothetical protein